MYWNLMLNICQFNHGLLADLAAAALSLWHWSTIYWHCIPKVEMDSLGAFSVDFPNHETRDEGWPILRRIWDSGPDKQGCHPSTNRQRPQKRDSPATCNGITRPFHLGISLGHIWVLSYLLTFVFCPWPSSILILVYIPIIEKKSTCTTRSWVEEALKIDIRMSEV